MKRLLLSLAACASAGLLLGGSRPAFTDLSAACVSALYDKEIKIAGNRVLAREEIAAALPREESIPWWHFNSSFIAAGLLKHPMLASAEVRRCGGALRLGCFEISVTERRPTFLTVVDGRSWIVAEDGGFIGPLPDLGPADRERFLDGRGSSLVLLDGVSLEGMSPDMARGRLLYLANALAVVRSEVKLAPRAIRLDLSGEMTMTFRNSGLSATFGFGGADLSSLGEEARRLSMLLSKFGEKARLIRTIDLAFNKMAVVRLVPPPSKGKARA